MRILLLIHPKTRLGAEGFGQTESWGLPPLSLAYIAALTPGHWKVRLVDEYVEKIDFAKEDADLVGISTYTSNAGRAYELSKMFCSRNIPVVLGGIHVSMVPDEAMDYADAVVVGEAESVWPGIIRDVESGNLKRRYDGARLPLENIPVPRRDLFSSRYEMDVVQTTRGCPFACEFCSVTAFNGAEYRQRPVQSVLDELATIKKKVVYFVDDNFFGVSEKHMARAFELCRGMIDRKMNKIWVTQTSINAASNKDLLKIAFASGCRGLYIGFESVGAESLAEMHKCVNLSIGLAGYRDAIRRIHECGICVIGAFILGNDHDRSDVFRKTLDFVNKAGVDVPQFGFLTPFPGTRLFDRFTAENRIFCGTYPADWDQYDTDHVVFRSLNLDAAELVRGFDYIVRQRFSPLSVIRQGIKTLFATGNIVSTVLACNMNRDSRRFYDYDRTFENAGAGDGHSIS